MDGGVLRTTTRWLESASQGLLEFAFPTRCAGCDRPGAVLCHACLASIVAIDGEESCPSCGAPEGRVSCRACDGVETPLTELRCVGPLERPLSRVVTIYKDGNERRLAAPLADLLAQTVTPWSSETDVVTWVPASRAAVARRGFDHAERLATALAERLALPAESLLAPTSTVRDQRGLGKAERAVNVREAFEVQPRRSLPARALLVDDVVTTGATLRAAAQALRRAGVREVRAVALARKT